MKKFIIKSSLFILPFFVIYTFNTISYKTNKADLIRLGYLYFNPSPNKLVSNKFIVNKHYTNVSEINLNTRTRFDVMTIGDSFSEQDSLGYKNFLAKGKTTVLHMDRFLSENNPIQKLIELINSDFFDYIEIDYIILQNIERHFVNRCQKIDYSKSIERDFLSEKISNYKKISSKESLSFFSKSTLNTPLINIQYLFSDKPNDSKTYKVLTNTKSLFSEAPKDLLFYQEDINNMKDKNNLSKIKISNDVMNNLYDLLSKKNIQLVVLISPDKYDLYYSFIKNKNNFPKPEFFNYLNTLDKNYNYVNAYGALSKELKKTKDIYYYGDTHWSPVGAKIIAEKIKIIIK